VTTVARDFHCGYLWGFRTIRKLSRQTCARRSPTRDLWGDENIFGARKTTKLKNAPTSVYPPRRLEGTSCGLPSVTVVYYVGNGHRTILVYMFLLLSHRSKYINSYYRCREVAYAQAVGFILSTPLTHKAPYLCIWNYHHNFIQFTFYYLYYPLSPHWKFLGPPLECSRALCPSLGVIKKIIDDGHQLQCFYVLQRYCMLLSLHGLVRWYILVSAHFARGREQ